MKADAVFGLGCLLMLLVSLVGCGQERADRLMAVGQVRVGAVLGAEDLAGFAVADEPREFRFPGDHGAHPEFRSEWWYLTAILDDATGSTFGVQFTLFRQALSPEPAPSENRWQSNQAYLAHFAVTDVAGGEHRVAERFARGHPQLAGVRADPFALWLEDWRIEAGGENWYLSARTPGHGVELALEMGIEPVLQGEGGLSRKGVDQASYYYSVPGIPVRGAVMVDGRERTVSGHGWLDREWSTSLLSGGQVGWDWFALQLGDGRKIMMFQLRRADGARDPYDQGLVIEPDRGSRSLGLDDFSLKPARYWTDDDGVRWPVAWTVVLGGEVWRVEAAVDDQKMDTAIAYWEGLVDVYDEAGARVGRGYLELTGY